MNITIMSLKSLKHITVDEANYLALKQLGNAGDSFNDVITKILEKLTPSQTDLRVGPLSQSAMVVNLTHTIHGDDGKVR